MQSLMLGLLAALLWGVHDSTVRRISAVADSAALYLVVLGVGAVLLVPLDFASGNWEGIASGIVAFSALAGLIYALGVYALFRAFTIGPVRLVAPSCHWMVDIGCRWLCHQLCDAALCSAKCRGHSRCTDCQVCRFFRPVGVGHGPGH